MEVSFFKYHGAGNDFIMIDDRQMLFNKTENQIKHLCHRHFGIGADGLILLRADNTADFRMKYFNSDGREGTMCGNGGRCIVRFAYDLGIIKEKTSFEAVDGLHYANIEKDIIHLKMADVNELEIDDKHLFLNTGSPHHIEFVDDLQHINVKEKGSKIRYGKPYYEEGTNVNFVKINADESLEIRTYERGVEDETLACGTGVTAAAIAAYEQKHILSNPVKVKAMGGELSVAFEKKGNKYLNIWLSGPAEMVFKGYIKLE